MVRHRVLPCVLMMAKNLFVMKEKESDMSQHDLVVSDDGDARARRGLFFVSRFSGLLFSLLSWHDGLRDNIRC